jgi:hypothetical protein
MRIPTGHETASARCADGVLNVTLIKPDTLLSKAINMGRLCERVSIAAQQVCTHFVGIEVDKVHVNSLMLKMIEISIL